MAALHVACPHCLGVDFRLLAEKTPKIEGGFEVTGYACQTCRRVSRAEDLIAGERIQTVAREVAP